MYDTICVQIAILLLFFI